MADVKKERKVKDFSKGMIYRIVCNITGDVYIGSSAQTCAQRLSQHVAHHKLWVNDNKRYCMSSYIIIGRNDYKIVLVETYPCKNNDELRAREQFWIDQTECVNKIRAHNTPEQKKQWFQDNAEHSKELHKKYYQDNFERLNEKNKQYAKDNSEKIAEYQKEYREAHKEQKKELDKNYRTDNAEQIAERRNAVITCECGVEFTQSNKSRHNKSQKHINFTQA